MVQRSADLGAATVDLLNLGLEQPRRLADGFLDGLARYWQVSFREDWDEIEPKLATTVAEARARMADGGLYAVLEGLRPRVRLDRDTGELWLRRAHEEQIALGEDAEILFGESVGESLKLARRGTDEGMGACDGEETSSTGP
jgi:hypothetical protein